MIRDSWWFMIRSSWSTRQHLSQPRAVCGRHLFGEGISDCFLWADKSIRNLAKIPRCWPLTLAVTVIGLPLTSKPSVPLDRQRSFVTHVENEINSLSSIWKANVRTGRGGGRRRLTLLKVSQWGRRLWEVRRFNTGFCKVRTAVSSSTGNWWR